MPSDVERGLHGTHSHGHGHGSCSSDHAEPQSHRPTIARTIRSLVIDQPLRRPWDTFTAVVFPWIFPLLFAQFGSATEYVAWFLLGFLVPYSVFHCFIDGHHPMLFVPRAISAVLPLLGSLCLSVLIGWGELPRVALFQGLGGGAGFTVTPDGQCVFGVERLVHVPMSIDASTLNESRSLLRSTPNGKTPASATGAVSVRSAYIAALAPHLRSWGATGVVLEWPAEPVVSEKKRDLVRTLRAAGLRVVPLIPLLDVRPEQGLRATDGTSGNHDALWNCRFPSHEEILSGLRGALELLELDDSPAGGKSAPMSQEQVLVHIGGRLWDVGKAGEYCAEIPDAATNLLKALVLCAELAQKHSVRLLMWDDLVAGVAASRKDWADDSPLIELWQKAFGKGVIAPVVRLDDEHEEILVVNSRHDVGASGQSTFGLKAISAPKRRIHPQLLPPAGDSSRREGWLAVEYGDSMSSNTYAQGLRVNEGRCHQLWGDIGSAAANAASWIDLAQSEEMHSSCWAHGRALRGTVLTLHHNCPGKSLLPAMLPALAAQLAVAAAAQNDPRILRRALNRFSVGISQQELSDGDEQSLSALLGTSNSLSSLPGSRVMTILAQLRFAQGISKTWEGENREVQRLVSRLLETLPDVLELPKPQMGVDSL